MQRENRFLVIFRCHHGPGCLTDEDVQESAPAAAHALQNKIIDSGCNTPVAVDVELQQQECGDRGIIIIIIIIKIIIPVCVCVRERVCVCVCLSFYITHTHMIPTPYLLTHIYISIHMHFCTCTCTCIHTHIHIRIHIGLQLVCQELMSTCSGFHFFFTHTHRYGGCMPRT